MGDHYCCPTCHQRYERCKCFVTNMDYREPEVKRKTRPSTLDLHFENVISLVSAIKEAGGDSNILEDINLKEIMSTLAQNGISLSATFIGKRK